MECNLNELVKHGLRALRETLPAEQDLTTKNVSIGIVGKDLEFTIYEMMMYLRSWKVLKKDHRERHSLLNLLMNLQKRLMNQWSIKSQTSLHVYYQICKNAGALTDDSNLYFEPKDAAWSSGMF